MVLETRKGRITMTFSEIYRLERKLLKDIDKEKKLTWRKLTKILELEALTGLKPSA